MILFNYIFLLYWPARIRPVGIVGQRNYSSLHITPVLAANAEVRIRSLGISGQ